MVGDAVRAVERAVLAAEAGVLALEGATIHQQRGGPEASAAGNRRPMSATSPLSTDERKSSRVGS